MRGDSGEKRVEENGRAHLAIAACDLKSDTHGYFLRMLKPTWRRCLLLRPRLDCHAELFPARSPRAVEVGPIDDSAHGLDFRGIWPVAQDGLKLTVECGFR